jgi:hypothetical protein
LYPLFGGYWGYQAAPLRKTEEQALVWRARKEVEAERENPGNETDIEGKLAAEEELGLQRER